MDFEERVIITDKIQSLCGDIAHKIETTNSQYSHTGDQKYGFNAGSPFQEFPDVIDYEIYKYQGDDVNHFQEGYRIFSIEMGYWFDVLGLPSIIGHQPVRYLDQEFNKTYPMQECDLTYHEQMIDLLSQILLSLTDTGIVAD